MVSRITNRSIGSKPKNSHSNKRISIYAWVGMVCGLAASGFLFSCEEPEEISNAESVPRISHVVENKSALIGGHKYNSYRITVTQIECVETYQALTDIRIEINGGFVWNTKNAKDGETFDVNKSEVVDGTQNENATLVLWEQDALGDNDRIDSTTIYLDDELSEAEENVIYSKEMKNSGDGRNYHFIVWYYVRPNCVRTGPDSDGDGLLDAWETNGYDANCDGILSPGDDVLLPQMGASPSHKDVLVELKWYDGYRPTAAAIDQVRRAFANAPITAGGSTNPDGEKGINIIFDAGNEKGYDPNLSEDGFGPGSCADGIQNGTDAVADIDDPDCWAFIGDEALMEGAGGEVLGNPNDNAPKSEDEFIEDAIALTDNARRGIFRFVHFGPAFEAGWGGFNSLVDQDYIYSDRLDAPNLMHELGHSFNLWHGGDENHNCKPNHLSVMNYLHSSRRGLQWQDGAVAGGALQEFIDYSPVQIPEEDMPSNARLPVLATLDERALAEREYLEVTPALDPRVIMIHNAFDPTLSEDGAGPGSCTDGIDNNAGGPNPLDGADDMDLDCRVRINSQLDTIIDWDGNNNTADTTENIDLFLDINSCATNTGLDQLHGYDEWSNIQIAPGWSIGGKIDHVVFPESLMSFEEGEAMFRDINRTDLAVQAGVATSSILTGMPFTLEIEASNQGRNPAARSVARVTLPENVALLDSNANCVALDDGLYECDLALLWARQVVPFDMMLEAEPNDTCGKRQITVQVFHLEGEDTHPENNVVIVDLLTVPEFTSFEDESRPWVGQHGSQNPTIVSEPTSHGTRALKLPCDYTTIDSPVFDSTELEILGNTLSIDVYVPQNVDNPYWVGDLQVALVAPAAGMWQQPIGGYVGFTPLERGAWSTVSFDLSQEQRDILEGDVSNMRFRLQANNSSCANPVVLDNVRFTGSTEARDIFHTCASSAIEVASSGVLSFDDDALWTANTPLWNDTSNVTEGEASLAFEPEGWTVLESVPFSTDTLTDITSILNLDIYIPALPPDPGWVGFVQAYLECPSQNVYNFYMDQVDLNHRFDGEFNSIGYQSMQFNVPEYIQTVLQSGANDCVFRFTLSSNPLGIFRFDNGGFVQ